MKNTIIAVLIAALVLLSSCAQIESKTISVEGSSEIKYKPDQAEVWVGVSILKLNAETAQTEANRVINAIIDGLRYKGFTENDISTENLNLYEEFDWSEGSQKSKGWRAAQTLKVKTTDLTKVGTIVDVAVSNGANQIQNINFGLSPAKESEFKTKALADASKNAKEKAEAIAQGLGARLGSIKKVAESNYYYTPYMYAMKEMTAGARAVEEAATVLPGDITISGRVSVEYYIK